MIFIAGNSRSGTALLGRMVSNHPDIFTFYELHFLEEIWMPVNETISMTKKEAVFNFAKLIGTQREGYLQKRRPQRFFDEAAIAIQAFDSNEITFAALYERFLDYETTLNNKKIACEKTPRNLLYITELLKIYPDCKIICLIRDPKDVMLSQKKKWKRRFLGGAAFTPLREGIRARINYHPFIIAHFWNVFALASATHISSGSVKTVFFEMLLSEPEATLRDVCSFLNISYTNEMLNVEQKGSSLVIDQKNNAHIDTSRIGNWKTGLNPTEVFICDYFTRKGRALFNYSGTGIRPSYFLLLFYALVFPLQLFIAFIVNLGRTKNLLCSIKKRFA